MVQSRWITFCLTPPSPSHSLTEGPRQKAAAAAEEEEEAVIVGAKAAAAAAAAAT